MPLLLLLLLVAPSVWGQQRPQSGVDTLSMWVIRGTDTLPVGRLMDHRELTVEGGDSVLRRVVITDAAIFGPRIDTIVSRIGTGTPIRYVGVTPRGADRVLVREGRARGRVTGVGGVVSETNIAIPDSTVFASNIDLALRESLFRFGEVIRLRVYVPPLGTVGLVGIRVEGEEEIAGERAWRLRALNLGNNATYWVSQRDRTLLRQTMVGPGGVTLLFDRRLLPRPVAPTPQT